MSQFIVEILQCSEKHFLAIPAVELDTNVPDSVEPTIRKFTEHRQFSAFDVNF
jgi:hypothetical protein